jgi:hypothetical protein
MAVLADSILMVYSSQGNLDEFFLLNIGCLFYSQVGGKATSGLQQHIPCETTRVSLKVAAASD